MTLKEARKAAGLPQKDVAAALQVTQGAVSLWESGNPPLKKYRPRLARLYGVAESELFKEEGPTHAP